MDRLPELLRQVVILAYFQGLKYRDVAEALDIPVGTVKSRLHAELARLTEAWGATTEGREEKPEAEDEKPENKGGSLREAEGAPKAEDKKWKSGVRLPLS